MLERGIGIYLSRAGIYLLVLSADPRDKEVQSILVAAQAPIARGGQDYSLTWWRQ